MTKRLLETIERRRVVIREVDRILKEDYPPGTPIAWRDATRLYKGQSVMNCYGDRIKVLNMKTGRERFIHADAIVNVR